MVGTYLDTGCRLPLVILIETGTFVQIIAPVNTSEAPVLAHQLPQTGHLEGLSWVLPKVHS
jgi:hypothetical protein